MRHSARSIVISLAVGVVSALPAFGFERLFDENRGSVALLDLHRVDRAGTMLGRRPYAYFGTGLLIALAAVIAEGICPTVSSNSWLGRKRSALGLLRAWALIGGVNAAVVILSLILRDVLLGLVFLGTLGPAAFLWSETN